MATKRDLVAEIVAKRRRNSRRNPRRRRRAALFFDRIFNLYDAIDLLRVGDATSKGTRYDSLRYVSIALVAAMEGYYRTSIRDLINQGEPFRSDAARLADLRLDVSTIMGLESAKISLGEFIAHLLPISSISDINRHMSTLIGEDHIARLKSTRWRGDEGETYGEAHPRAWEALEELFQDRHIACHELSPKHTPTFARVTRQWRTVCLLGFTDEVVIDTLLRLPATPTGDKSPAI